MSGLVIDPKKCTRCGLCIQQCPFNAMAMVEGQVQINAACKMCRMCLRNCPNQAISEQTDAPQPQIDKSQWHDILVYVEHSDGRIHPVTLELIGKAQELAQVIGQQVNCLMIGDQIEAAADSLLDYGVANVYLYEDPRLKYFRADNYTEVFEDCIQRSHPTVVLVGATVSGRSLAPRTAARFRTGLTADCTVLEMRENTDLVQIRPAFGGNIMAQILNTNHRPQFATVRYKVMDAAQKQARIGQVVSCSIDSAKLDSKIEWLKIEKKEQEVSISDAEILVAVGRGVKDEKTLALIETLAQRLHAQMACSRPFVESGRYDVKKQIGLSGRTVKPKLILTFGISGAIQFTAGMKGAEKIIAVNTDPQAPIFDLAHVAVVGDAGLIAENMLKEMEGEAVCSAN